MMCAQRRPARRRPRTAINPQRSIALVVLAVALAFASGHERLLARQAGSPLRAGANVNMGAGPLQLVLDANGNILKFIGDPLQRQSEPSIACSPHNPQMCVAAANDTKLVDAPRPITSTAITADAWLGLFWTTNGGKTWTTKLVPGFPRDASPEGLASPIRGKQAAADPTVRAGVRINADGSSDALFYVSGIAFNRPDITEVKTAAAGSEGKKGKAFVSVYRDPRDATREPVYEGTWVIDDGGTGQFLDKTWIDVDFPRGSQGCGVVQFGETIFTGNGTNNPAKLYTTRSTDCGRTWAQPTKLSEGQQTVQSANVAFNLKNGDVYITWRQFATSNLSSPGRIFFSKSSNGKNWSNPVVIRTYGLWNASTAPDQPALPGADPPYDALRMFRTNAYPNMCVTTDGVIRIVFSERKGGDPNAFARIMVAKSTNGDTWTIGPVDDAPDLKGNQVMPAIACNTRAIVAWFDQRNDSAPKAFGWETLPNLFGKLIVDPIPPPPAHTVDVRAAETMSSGQFGPSIQVSRYRYGWLPPGPTNPAPVAFQTEQNVVNWPQYGKLPFLGDYLDVTVDRRIVPYSKSDGTTGWRAFGLNPDGSVNAAEASESLGAHVTWTDNRNVLPSFFDRNNPDPNKTPGTPEPQGAWVTIQNGQEVESWQPTSMLGACDANSATPTANKDQNVYTAYVSDGLQVGELEESQTAGALRAYAVFIKNTTSSTRRFQVSTDNGSLSYSSQVPSVSLDIPGDNTRAVTVVLNVAPPAQPPRTTVSVVEQSYPGTTSLGLNRSIVLTPGNASSESHTVDLQVHPFTFTVNNPIFDPDNPIFDPDNPIFDPDNPIFDPDNPIFDPDNPIFDPDNPIFDPDNPIFDPDNPIFDPDNPIFDPDNPIFDPDNPIFDPDNPIFDPDNSAPDAYDQPLVTQITATVTNQGNVSGGYDIAATLSSLPADVVWQLVVARVTPATRTLPGQSKCNVYNLPRAEAVTNIGGTGSTPIGTTSAALASGETALLLLRVYHHGQLGLPGQGTEGETFLKKHLTVTVSSQAEPPVSWDFYGNHAPVATNTNAQTNEDTPKAIALSATDADLDTLAYSIVAAPQHGTVDLSGATANYTPAPDYAGADSFTFKVNDGSVDSNVATVSVTINPVNDAPVASAGSLTTSEDTPANGALGASDIDSAALTYSIVAQGSKGTASVTNAATGAFTYTPNANANGADSFTFKVNDGSLDSNVATVSVTINAVNDAPIATDGSLTTDEDTAKGGTLTGSDIDSAALTYSIVAQGSKGTAVVTNPATGAFTYTPNANANGADSFTFKVNDGSLNSNTATVSVTINAINDAPSAAAGSLGTTEDTPANGALGASDVDSAALTYSIVAQGSKGIAVVTNAATGAYTYTPNANANGADSFTFKANDGSLDSNVAVVAVTIAAVNDPPVAAADTKAGIVGVPLTFPASDLTANDNAGPADEPQGLTVTGVSNPVRGTLSLNAGSVTFTPNSALGGSFTYTVCDTSGSCVNGNVTITTSTSYGFNGLLAPWQQGVSSKLGSTFQIVWQYTNASGTPVNSGPLSSPTGARPELLAYGPLADTSFCAANGGLAPLASMPAAARIVDDPGSSSFQYNATTFTWQYNWQPSRTLAAGCYAIFLRSQATGQVNGGFGVKLNP